MDYKKVARYVVLGILFFLPVTFLLFLYPATHQYTPLDIVHESVLDLKGLTSESDPIVLKDHITVLGFLGQEPMDHMIAASNLKELVYDKFKGFKRFQVVLVMPLGTEEAVDALKQEINTYGDMRFWHFVYGSPEQIQHLYKRLKSNAALDPNLATDEVFIIDQDLNQRGRLDDREDRDIAKQRAVFGLYSYNCIEVAEIKNKMSEDMRILFTEYRQKRKGDFDSSTRRANDLNAQQDEEN